MIAKLLTQNVLIDSWKWNDHNTIILYIDDDNENGISITEVLYKTRIKINDISEWNYIDANQLQITVY